MSHACATFDNNCRLTYPNVRFIILSVKHPKSNPDVNEAASALGKRSAEVRQKNWGKKEFQKRMREWGKLGGRPKKTDKDRKGKQ
jgi:hypothetical protein